MHRNAFYLLSVHYFLKLFHTNIFILFVFFLFCLIDFRIWDSKVIFCTHHSLAEGSCGACSPSKIAIHTFASVWISSCMSHCCIWLWVFLLFWLWRGFQLRATQAFQISVSFHSLTRYVSSWSKPQYKDWYPLYNFITLFILFYSFWPLQSSGVAVLLSLTAYSVSISLFYVSEN